MFCRVTARAKVSQKGLQVRWEGVTVRGPLQRDPRALSPLPLSPQILQGSKE